jgi:site-specific DNA-methyltransferase (adenine-specific)
MANINFHNIDCMEFIKSKPNNYYGLAICDIPYGIDVANMPFLKEMNTTVKQKNGTKINGNGNKKPYALKDWDKETPTQKYFDELRRVSKEQIIFGVDYVNWTGLGKGRIKWDKGFAEGMSFNRYETAYCSLIDYEIEIPFLWAGMMQAKA